MNTFDEHISIRKEQIKGILDQSPTNIVANSFVVALSFWGFNSYNPVDRLTGFIWLFFVVLVIVLQVKEVKQFKITGLDGEKAARLLRGSILAALFTGTSWAVFTVLFFDESGALVYLMAVLVCGMLAGSVTSVSIYLPLYFLFSFPLIATFVYLLINSNYQQHGLISMLMIVFYVMSSYMAYIFNKRVLESFRLRFINSEMLNKLHEQKLIAEKANIAKSKFLAAASHDLRQPLHALGFFIDALKASPEKNTQLFEKVEASITNLKDMFDAMLDVSKLDAGVIFVNKIHFKASRIFNLIMDEYQIKAQDKGLQLTISADDVVLFSDPDLLKRLVGNLVSNSIRYTKKGSISIEVVNLDASRTSISVTDTGIGIPIEELDNVYDEFYQLNNPERDRRKGLGLGLAIVKKLSLLLEVDVELKTREGVGTAFILILETGDENKIVSEPTMPDYQNKNLKGKNILVVDDEIDIRKAMQYSLAGWGCNFLGCESSADALAKISEQGFDYDLIISDLRLRKEENGIDTIRTIFDKTNKQTAAILISGDTSPESISNAQKSGFALLHKPLRPAELRLHLISLLR